VICILALLWKYDGRRTWIGGPSQSASLWKTIKMYTKDPGAEALGIAHRDGNRGNWDMSLDSTFRKKCSGPQIMVTPQISRYYALHCKGQGRVNAQEALTTRQCPSSLLRTTNGSAEPSAWKKIDVSSDIKAGSLPRTYSVELGRKRHKEFV